MGRLLDADRIGRVDDTATDTMVQIFVKLDGDRVGHATFRTFGCSACIAASSIATELLLGGLPADKRYCAELVAEAARRALTD